MPRLRVHFAALLSHRLSGLDNERDSRIEAVLVEPERPVAYLDPPVLFKSCFARPSYLWK